MIEIQTRIAIPEEHYEKVIKNIQKLSKDFRMVFGKYILTKAVILQEVKNLTTMGKKIIMIEYYGKGIMNERKEMHK